MVVSHSIHFSVVEENKLISVNISRALQITSIKWVTLTANKPQLRPKKKFETAQSILCFVKDLIAYLNQRWRL